VQLGVLQRRLTLTTTYQLDEVLQLKQKNKLAKALTICSQLSVIRGSTVKTLCFRSILISQFSCVENSLHFNLADFPMNIIKPFASCFFWCLNQILLSKFLSYYCSLPRILHIIDGSVDIPCR